MTNRLERFKAHVEPRLERLFRVALRLTGNRQDAEDLVQEACLMAWEKLPEDATPDHAGHWLTRVLYHRFVDGTRRRQHRPFELHSDEDLSVETIASPHAGPCELTEFAEQQRMLEHAWAQLQPSQQMLLSLRAEGFRLAEIEEISGLNREVLRARLHRARQSLTRHLMDFECALGSRTAAETQRAETKL